MVTKWIWLCQACLKNPVQWRLFKQYYAQLNPSQKNGYRLAWLLYVLMGFVVMLTFFLLVASIVTWDTYGVLTNGAELLIQTGIMVTGWCFRHTYWVRRCGFHLPAHFLESCLDRYTAYKQHEGTVEPEWSKLPLADLYYMSERYQHLTVGLWVYRLLHPKNSGHAYVWMESGYIDIHDETAVRAAIKLQQSICNSYLDEVILHVD